MTMAREERERIVRYLRDTQAHFEKQNQATPLVAKHHAESCKFSADAIERGEHWIVN